MLKTALALVCVTSCVSFSEIATGTAFAQTEAKVHVDPLSIGRVTDRGRIPNSLDEMMSKTVGRVSEKAVKGYQGNFAAYWKSSETSRVGKALEAVVCDTVNGRNRAVGSMTRWATTASLGYPAHPADIVELDAKGKVIRKIQAGTGHTNVLSKLVDSKYKGMDILTDSDTLSSLRKHLVKQSSLGKQSGRSLKPQLKALQDALSSGRLIMRLPQGTPLPTKQFITKQAQAHAGRCFKQTMQSVHKVIPNKLTDKALRPGKDIARIGRTPKIVICGLPFVKPALRGAPLVAGGVELIGLVTKATDVENIFRDGKISQKQREREHVKNVAGAVGGLSGGLGGAYAGAKVGGSVGTAGGPWGAGAGAIVGGVAGGVAGYHGGEAAATAAADWSMKKVHQTGNTIAGTVRSATNWTAKKASQTGNTIAGTARSATNWSAKKASQTGNAIAGAAGSARNRAVNAWDYVWGN